MKRLAIGMLGVGIVVGLGFLLQNETEYISPQKEVVEVEVTPEWASDEDAVKAAQAVIRRKELEAELSALEADKAAIQTRIDEVEKELGTY